jgi:hypothetical protein
LIAEEFAPAKVNLWLRVTGRRADGYHELDSLVVFAGVGDVLRAEPAAALTLEIDGPFAGALAGEADNLVLRAARAVAPGVGARLVLTKNLPVAAGLGGGSADAAAAIRVMARLAAASAPSPHPDPPPRGGREEERSRQDQQAGADHELEPDAQQRELVGVGERFRRAQELQAGEAGQHRSGDQRGTGLAVAAQHQTVHQREAQVCEPFRADRPGREIPRQHARETPGVQQAEVQHQLAHREPLRHARLEVRQQRRRPEHRHDQQRDRQVHGIDAGQARHQEPAVFRRSRRHEPAAIDVGQDEPGQHEETVHRQVAVGTQRFQPAIGQGRQFRDGQVVDRNPPGQDRAKSGKARDFRRRWLGVAHVG